MKLTGIILAEAILAACLLITNVHAFKTQLGVSRLSTDSASLSAAQDALDSGILSSYNLQAIENSLLAMSASIKDNAEEYNSTLGPFITQIRVLTDMMKGELRKQHGLAQDDLDRSWLNFLNCTENASEDAFRDLIDWNKTHIHCRYDEAGLYHGWETCLENLDVLIMSEKTWQELYNDANVMPYDCHHPADPIPHISSKPYILDLRNHFRNQWVAWHDALIKFEEAHNKTVAKQKECEQIDLDYGHKTAKCDGYQRDLEQHACGEGSDDCKGYMKCYIDKEQIWLEQNKSASDQEYGMKSEWRGILRIQCLLDAFSASIDRKADLNEGINLCQNATFLDLHFNSTSVMDIEFHPVLALNESVPPFIYCNETHNESYQPGSLDFALMFYPNLPAPTNFEACDAHYAHCCETEHVWVQDNRVPQWCGSGQNKDENYTAIGGDYDFTLDDSYGWKLCGGAGLPEANLTQMCKDECAVGTDCAMFFVAELGGDSGNQWCCFPSKKLWTCTADVTDPLQGSYYLNTYGQLLLNTTGDEAFLTTTTQAPTTTTAFRFGVSGFSLSR